MTDPDYLQLTLQLAQQGAALVSPNPMVGSVVVNKGQIVGRGYHRFDEVKHAEVWALEEAGPRARGATAYINLEPCCHRGPTKRTPPCVDALIRSGVSRVVASMVDPNPAVNGRGFDELRHAGISVTIGEWETEARRLNEKYVTFVTTGRPFVHLKLACSMDGRIATRTGDAKWISNEESRAASQAMRHEYDAILAGINTVLIDDPFLTDRTGSPRHRPLTRVVLDSALRTPPNSNLVRTAGEAPVVIFCATPQTTTQQEGLGELMHRRGNLESCGVDVVTVASGDGHLDLAAALDELGTRKLISLIVEGGSEVAASFIAGRLIDKVSIFYAPKIIGGRDAVPAIGGDGIANMSDALDLDDLQVVRRGGDWEATGYPRQGARGGLNVDDS